MPVFCGNCGAKLEAGDAFCVACGARQPIAADSQSRPTPLAVAATPAPSPLPSVAVQVSSTRRRLYLGLTIAAIVIVGSALYLYRSHQTSTAASSVVSSFSSDAALDPQRWQASTPLLAALGEAQGCRYVEPQITFDRSE